MTAGPERPGPDTSGAGEPGARKRTGGDAEADARDWVQRRFRKHTPGGVRARTIRNKDELLKHGIGWRASLWSEKPVLAVWLDARVRTDGYLGAAWGALCRMTDAVCELVACRSPAAHIKWWWPHRLEKRAVLAAPLEEGEVLAEPEIAGRALDLGFDAPPARVMRILRAFSNQRLLQQHGDRVMWLRYAIWTSAGLLLRRLVDRGMPVGVCAGGRQERQDPALVPDLRMCAVVPDGAPDADLESSVLANRAAGLPCSFRLEAMRFSDFRRERRLPGTRAHFASNNGVALLGAIPKPVREAEQMGRSR